MQNLISRIFFLIFERTVKPSRRRRDQTEITELLNLWHKLWKKNCELPNQALISYQYSIYTSWPPEAIEKSCEGHNQANNLNLQTKTKGGVVVFWLYSGVLTSFLEFQNSYYCVWVLKQINAKLCKKNIWNDDDDAKMIQLIYPSIYELKIGVNCNLKCVFEWLYRLFKKFN